MSQSAIETRSLQDGDDFMDSKRPLWLIQNDDPADEDSNRLRKSARKVGCRVDFFGEFGPLDRCELDYLILEFEAKPAICHGSFIFAQTVNKYNVIPGVYCNWGEYKCSQFYPKYKAALLNSTYILLPYGDLDRFKDRIIGFWGDMGDSSGWWFNSRSFIRPNSGFKPFAGGELIYKNWEDLRHFANGSIQSEEICLVAPPKKISREWRLFVSDRVITGSQYKKDGEIVLDGAVPQEVIDFATPMIPLYRPDSIFSLDIAESGGRLGVLEVGAFSTSGLYKSDTDLLVEEVNRLVGEEL